MHTNFLHYLDEVARQGSIRKAASFLNMSSTSVNRKIIKIESELGISLFERSSEGVELTAAGKVVLEHCRKTLYEYDRVKAIIDDIRDLRTGHLSVQTLDSVTFGVLPDLIQQFSDKYPGISLSISTAKPTEIVSTVLSGETDVGITFTNDLRAEVDIVAEKSAPFGVVMRPDHPLAERTSISIDDLAGYPLVRTTDARAGNSLLDQEIAHDALPLTTHLFTNSHVIAKQAIRANQVIGIYTKIGFLMEIETGELKFAKLAHRKLSEYRIGLIVSSSGGIDPTRRIFLSMMEHALRELSLD